MPTSYSRTQIRIQAMTRYASRHMPCRLHMPDEWPYMAGSTCLVVLLIWQPFAPAAVAIARPDSSYSSQRSLHEIETHCLENQPERLVREDCVENCGAPDSPPPELGLGASQFSRSILTCRDSTGTPSRTANINSPHNLIIEVVRASRTF